MVDQVGQLMALSLQSRGLQLGLPQPTRKTP